MPSIRQPQRSTLIAVSCVLVIQLMSVEARAEISVACAPDRAFAPKGDSVVVRAWVTSADGERVQPPASFTWRAAKGTISGGERATWVLTAASFATAAGASTTVPVTASVIVEVPKQGTGTCEVTVFVALVPIATNVDPQRSARLAARMFLLSGMTEPLEYGLRSYLIFSARPRDQGDEERYVKAVEAYLQVFVPVEDFLVQNVRASHLNVTMLPLVEPVGSLAELNTVSGERALALEIVRKYDYARATALLNDLGVGEVGGGPYLIARETQSRAAPQEKLVVDMSGVSSELIRDWMTWFCWLTAQERTWGQATLKRLGLNLRNVIAVTAETTPVVLTSLVPSVSILKPRR